MWAETGWVTIVKYLGGTEGWSTRKGAVGGTLCWIIWVGQQCREDEKKRSNSGVAYMCEWGGAQGWISGVERTQGTAVTSTRDISNCFVYLPWQQLVIWIFEPFSDCFFRFQHAHIWFSDFSACPYLVIWISYSEIWITDLLPNLHISCGVQIQIQIQLCFQ